MSGFNIAQTRQQFAVAREMLLDLEDTKSGKKIWDTKKRVPIVGFLQDMAAAEYMFDTLCIGKKIKFKILEIHCHINFFYRFFFQVQTPT
jgi:hypothetical protein